MESKPSMPNWVGSADMALSFSIFMVMSLPSSVSFTVSPSSSQVPVAVSRSSWFLQGLVSAVPSSLR